MTIQADYAPAEAIAGEDEHQISFLSRMTSVLAQTKHVMVMYGQAVEYSDVRSIYKNPLHPYTAGLLRSIQKLTDDDMEGCPAFPAWCRRPVRNCRAAGSRRGAKCGARCRRKCRTW